MERIPVQLVHFEKISVNLIESNSGIFVGNINANGWHSNNKNNNGFGSVSESSLNHSISLVIDNDAIDAVINDYNFSKDNRVVNDVKSTQVIRFDSINVNSQSIACGINTGESDLRNWRSHSKINKGFGNAAGINEYSQVVNETIDNDIIDTQVDDFSFTNLNAAAAIEVDTITSDLDDGGTKAVDDSQNNNENKQPDDPTA